MCASLLLALCSGLARAYTKPGACLGPCTQPASSQSSSSLGASSREQQRPRCYHAVAVAAAAATGRQPAASVPLPSTLALFVHPLLAADQLALITAFRDAMLARPVSRGWAAALRSWTCPTDPANSVGATCDPCGQQVRLAGLGWLAVDRCRATACMAKRTPGQLGAAGAGLSPQRAARLPAPPPLHERLCQPLPPRSAAARRCGATGSTWRAGATA